MRQAEPKTKATRRTLKPVAVSAKALGPSFSDKKIDAKCEIFARRKDETEINLYGEVGFWGVTAKDFRAALEQVDTPRLILNLNSPGGDVFDGIAIYNDLLAHKADVVVRVTGVAASVASVIAMAGDTIEIAENAFFMIHNAWSVAVGDTRVMASRAKLLSKIDGELAETYAARTGGDLAEIKSQMDDETWLTADEAVEQGFADETISTDEGAEARAAFDLTNFKNVPRALKPTRCMAKAKASEAPAKPALTDVELASISQSLDAAFAGLVSASL